MKVKRIKNISVSTPIMVADCFVDNGYLQGPGGSLPDVDVDYQSDKRQEIKEYTERRYNLNGKQRVFSAGTVTTLKVKAVIKDVARTMRIPVGIVNYINAIFDDDKCDFTGIFKLAAENKKVAKFIEDYPTLFEDIRTLMFQPRSNSVHASALIVTPDEKDGEPMECFDYVPIKKVDNILVSENDGYELDELGLLKNDCLATKELSKLHSIMDICNEVYGSGLSLEKLAMSDLNDPKVYEILSKGHTQDIFQFSSKGMTKFLVSMKPTVINDLIAANALYRPATLENGSTESYIDCKRGDTAPTYLWGTYNALKDTFGLITYQEQVVFIAREVGNFSLGDGVKLVKFISKKKTDKIQSMKDKFMKGAKENGCPKEDAEAIWAQIEACGSYLFNKCISGKEYIMRPNGGKKGRTNQLTIGEMYKTMHDSKWARENGHRSLHDRYKRLGYGTGWSLVDENNEQYLIKNKIVDIRYMGIRPIYRITLANGATIDVTENHKHPTNNGMKRTDEIVVGVDKMYVSIGSLSEDTVYRFTDKDGAYNDPYYHETGNEEHYKINAQKGHCGFIKRDSNYTKLEEYKNKFKPSYCEKCGKTEGKLEVHHINGNHSDCGENFSNLITLCPSCHKKEHYKMGRKKMGEKGLYTELQTVVSIEYIGDDEVYDVEMADPYHTFTTGNGVVTCNSHATAYAVTSYVGAYLKANYPTAFYSVALEWADDKDIPVLMSEMEQCSQARVVHPDINISQAKFHTDYTTDSIFWSLTKIKMVGVKAVDWIVEERNVRGEYTSIENFIERVFRYKLKQYKYFDDPDDEEEMKRCPVNARHVLNLILAGCFDNIENAKSVVERYAIVQKAATKLGFEVKEKDFPADMIGKHYYWSQKQLEVSSIGAIDYKRAYDNSSIKEQAKKRASYATLKDVAPLENDGKRVAICATVVEYEEKKYQSKKTGDVGTFVKMLLQQGNDLCECIVWSEEYNKLRPQLMNVKNKLIVFTGVIKYSDFTGKNNIQLTKNSLLEIL